MIKHIVFIFYPFLFPSILLHAITIICNIAFIKQEQRPRNNCAHNQTCKPSHGKTNNVVSEQVCHKPGCTRTEDRYRLEILDLGSRGIALSMQRKQRLISFAVADLHLWILHRQFVGFLMRRLILSCFLAAFTCCPYKMLVK